MKKYLFYALLLSILTIQGNFLLASKIRVTVEKGGEVRGGWTEDEEHHSYVPTKGFKSVRFKLLIETKEGKYRKQLEITNQPNQAADQAGEWTDFIEINSFQTKDYDHEGKLILGMQYQWLVNDTWKDRFTWYLVPGWANHNDFFGVDLNYNFAEESALYSYSSVSGFLPI